MTISVTLFGFCVCNKIAQGFNFRISDSFYRQRYLYSVEALHDVFVLISPALSFLSVISSVSSYRFVE